MIGAIRPNQISSYKSHEETMLTNIMNRARRLIDSARRIYGAIAATRAASGRALRGICCLVAVAGVSIAGELRMPSVFSDHMVLQRDRALPIWGRADPGAKVRVTFGSQTKTAMADAEGRWRVELSPLAASSEGRVFAVASEHPAGGERVEFGDVLVGEVWLCSGQSNMELPLGGSKKNPVLNSAAEVAAANRPLIRLYRTPKVYASAPLPRIDAQWEVCSPASARDFSAVAYFFGCKLQRDLGVPVGLLQAAWGGTSIDPWTAPGGYEGIVSLDNLRRIAENMPPLGEEKDPAKMKRVRQTPTALFNGMIHAHIPFGIRGTIWYQGEHDHLDGMLYVDKTRALLNGWRKAWGYDFPFYFVQIAPFAYGEGGNEDPSKLPVFWEAQAEITRVVPFTAMAVISDAATPNSIHPPNKEVPGIRLALLAEAHTYGLDVVSSGPVLRKMERMDGTLRVVFDNADGLATRDGREPDCFEVAGSDGVFRMAKAVIEGSSVVIRSPDVPQPQAMRFGWDKIAIPNLVNGAGLPAGAFRAGEVRQ